MMLWHCIMQGASKHLSISSYLILTMGQYRTPRFLFNIDSLTMIFFAVFMYRISFRT